MGKGLLAGRNEKGDTRAGSAQIHTGSPSRRVQIKAAVLPHQSKAAEDSRTPRRWRDGLHASHSARSWSAAVLCRFLLTLPRLCDSLVAPFHIAAFFTNSVGS